MKITSFKIKNYKSFLSIKEIQFTPGFNVIVGPNDVGKTAFVEALSLQYGHNPHRSLETIPYRNAKPDPLSLVDITFELNRKEFLQLLIDFMPKFHVPNPPPGDYSEKFLNAISDRNIIKCSYQSGNFQSAFLEAYGDFRNAPCLEFEIRRGDEQPKSISSVGKVAYPGTFAMKLADILKGQIYIFKSERLNVGESEMGRNTILSSNASNLAQVLNLLITSNTTRFQEFNQLVNIIFPQIKQITVPPINDRTTRILIWTINPNSQRDDLAVSLANSGTGIGQVLAMLYVVLTSDFPRTIIIDEPQSFLHPGAIRKLFDILKNKYKEHQYIITTHSPTVVTSADAQTLFMIRKEEAKSIIKTIDVTETQQLQIFLSEVGARLSDVFGADYILWVEGRTEELCFPLILSKIAKKPLLGTAIVGVRQTGDFKGKYSKTIFDIYTSLSKGKGLLPPAIGFIFDKEGRSDKEREDLERTSKGTVFFTKRRMYENYLLKPQAIAFVMSTIDGFRKTGVTPEEVEAWLKNNQWNTEYFSTPISQGNQSESLWIENVHGAKLLQKMFGELSENRVNFDKVEHGKKLTDWIIENSPQDLEEIVGLTKAALSVRND